MWRLRVYAGFAVTLVLLIGGTWWLDRQRADRSDIDWANFDFAGHPDVQLLREYVRIDTSPTTGSEVAGAEFLAGQLSAAGLEPRIERLGDGQANVWAMLEGESREAIVLHNHIDVYPIVDPEAWDHPPFAAEIELAWLYGRGVFDMKSVTVAQLRAITALQESGRKPSRSVLFLATGSEEVGSELGARWVLREHPELAERFWVVLTEGGVVEPVSRSEIKYWGIEFSQKRFATAVACAADREPLEELRAVLEERKADLQPWRRTAQVDRFLSVYAESRNQELYREVLAQTWRALHSAADFRSLPEYIQSMFRDEAVPFTVEEDPEGGYRLQIILHLLADTDPEEALERLLPGWLRHGLALHVEPVLGSGEASAPDHPAFAALSDAVRKEYPGTPVGPYYLPWSATDARFFRAAGIPAFGFSPFLIYSTDTFRVDSANERLELPGFVRGVQLYVDAIERLAG